MKTKEDILQELCEKVTGKTQDYSQSWLLEAMEQYAQQQLNEERNRTIEEAINIVNGTDGIHWLKSKLIIEELKKLKR
jgi:hypothetical protein